MISSFVRALVSAFKARRELALDNVALRQQLAVLRRSVKRPRLSNVDRGFWVLLRSIWTDWESVLVIVKPETVVLWHLCGFIGMEQVLTAPRSPWQNPLVEKDGRLYST